MSFIRDLNPGLCIRSQIKTPVHWSKTCFILSRPDQGFDNDQARRQLHWSEQTSCHWGPSQPVDPGISWRVGSGKRLDRQGHSMSLAKHSCLKILLFEFEILLPHIHKRQSIHCTTHTCIINQFHVKMIVLVHFNRDFMRKNPLLALGFKPTTNWIAFSYQVITFLTGIFILHSVTLPLSVARTLETLEGLAGLSIVFGSPKMKRANT